MVILPKVQISADAITFQLIFISLKKDACQPPAW